MKIPVATAIHVITAVATATTLVVAYAWVSVYLLANIDPKFGATGTVQLYGLIAVLSSGAARAAFPKSPVEPDGFGG